MAGRPDRCRSTVTALSVVLLVTLATLTLTSSAPSGGLEPRGPTVRLDHGSAQARWLADFDAVWSLAAGEFVDPTLGGLDWPAIRDRYRPQVEQAASREEAAARINAMLAELRMSHTRYYTKAEPAYYFLLDLFRSVPRIRDAVALRFGGDRPSYTGIGVFTEERDGAVFVRAIVDGGPADRSGLKVGDRLLTVDSEPWGLVKPFIGRAGSAVPLHVQRTADPASVVTVVVVPERITPTDFYLRGLRESARILSHRGRSIAYAHVWSWAGDENQELLTRLLEDELAPAEALVLDLRDGWGGASPRYLNLFNTRIPTMTGASRDGTPRTFGPPWAKPVALLVDGTTRSGKEIVAHGFQRYGYGPIVGERTAGAVTAGRCFPLGSDAVLYLAVGSVLVDGERLEGSGVAPDLEVSRDVRYAAGADPQLDAALDLLADRLESGQRGAASGPHASADRDGVPCSR